MEENRAAIKTIKGGIYRVEAVLGAGGFGITYRCADSSTGARCAVKEYMPEAIAGRDPVTGRIRPEAGRERAFEHGKKRFLEEAQILMRMKDIPAVVHVREAFEENNTAYYVMEFLEGKTLKQVMRAMGGKLPYSAACEAVIKAGTALDQVHRQAGIFHRDISPENIMVLPDGQVKIIDFGSAKSTSVAENQQFSVVLKPGFAPPEQYASNLSQGSFTDVYAMAGTFYYAASGKMIPVAPDRMMGAEYEPLHELVPECSVRTSEAVDRALMLDAKFRTQTMSELVQGIAEGAREAAGRITVGGMQAAAKTGAGKGAREAVSRVADGAMQSAGADMRAQEDGRGTGVGMQTAAGAGTGGAWEAADHVGAAFRSAAVFSPEPEAIAPKAWLEVLRGACIGKVFPLEPNVPYLVGRSSKKSDFVLDGHPEISGFHFRIMYMPEKAGFYIIDESVNGLYCQGIRLEKGRKYKVLPGEQVGVGSMQCVITVGARTDLHS